MSKLFDDGSTSSTPPTTRCERMIQIVSNSKNERLLEKYYDTYEFDFEYEKSGIWSPPMRRTAYMGSPGRVLTGEELMAKLSKALESGNGGGSCSQKKCMACSVGVWGCISSLFCSFQKRIRKRKEITFGM